VQISIAVNKACVSVSMKLTSQNKAIAKLAEIRNAFRAEISHKYEHRAKSCLTCETPGACCLDAHFVNVRISRLEAAAINNVLAELPTPVGNAVRKRIAESIDKYKLDEAIETETATYACPLFERGTGCLVHETAKPLPCIAHACYDTQADMPPDELLDGAEMSVHLLNTRTYGRSEPLVSIPIVINLG